jgi:hypothetical protein
MLEIVLFFLALLLLATPFLAFYLLTKVTQLRREVDLLTAEKSRENSSLWREVNELKLRVAEPASQEAESGTARATRVEHAPASATTAAVYESASTETNQTDATVAKNERSVVPDAAKIAIPPAPVTIHSEACLNTEKKQDEPVPASPSSVAQTEDSAGPSVAAQTKGSIDATGKSVDAASTTVHRHAPSAPSPHVPPAQPTTRTDANVRIATPSAVPLRSLTSCTDGAAATHGQGFVD